MWDETEAYFHPVTLADIDALVPKLSFGSSALASCLTIPVSRNVAGVNKDDVLDAATVEASPSFRIVKKDVVEGEQRAEQVAEEQALEIDEVGAGTDSSLDKEQDDRASLNGLLCSKKRFILTSERPNKKRKLLGGDAGGTAVGGTTVDTSSVDARACIST
ncbi:uncharacterized protein [Elaeis guineensis]|uniref:uncharacterized protein n=1 Tax=Elaeis guineensis var. tenera TaxID=51953 RepID=UPI003C6D16BE